MSSVTSPLLITMPSNDNVVVPRKSASENRRSNKPIMEKRRRARINNCLNELKSLILEAMKKDPARHSKLEKADILEMTVRHLQTLQRQQTALHVTSDPQVANKFKAGFNECASEVSRFLSRAEGFETPVKQRLLGHLANCINGVPSCPAGLPAMMEQSGPLQLQIPSVTAQPQAVQGFTTVVFPPQSPPQTPPGAADAKNIFAGMHLVPTRLPNGETVFMQILPSPALPQQQSPSESHQSHQSSSPVPVIVQNHMVHPDSLPRHPLERQQEHPISYSPPQTRPISYSPPPHFISRNHPYQQQQLTKSQLNKMDYDYQYDRPLALTVHSGRHAQSPAHSTGSQSSLSPSCSETSSDYYLQQHQEDYSLQKPLSLVVKKDYQQVSSPSYDSCDEKPWRPW